MRLNTLCDKGSLKKRKRIGRGIGSGTGKTAGAGHKGQKARSGVSINGFEGGQMPLHRRLPKRGFNSPFKKKYAVLSIVKLDEAITAKKIKNDKIITEIEIKNIGLIGKLNDGVKLLANGKIKNKINCKVTKASKAAVLAISEAGGKVEIIELSKKEIKKKPVKEIKE